jgi:hypothetical protein
MFRIIKIPKMKYLSRLKIKVWYYLINMEFKA